MAWIILSVIVCIGIIFIIRHLLRGGNYAVITRNVVSWYYAFLLINDGMNNSNLKLTSLLEAAAIGSQIIYLKNNDFSLAKIKETVGDVSEEFDISEVKWNEINPELEVEILQSLVTKLMVLIFEVDFKKIGSHQMIAGIEDNKSKIKKTIYQHLQKSPGGVQIIGARNFAKRNPNYLEGLYVDFNGAS